MKYGEYLQNMQDAQNTIANIYADRGDTDMVTFHKNAAKGFEKRLNETPITELRKEMLESEVVEQVKAVIAATGLKIQRINTGCFKVGKRFIRTATKGTLDFEGYDNHGRHVGIECKRPEGGRISPEQRARIDDINAKGGVAGIVTSGKEAYDLLASHNCI